MNHLHFFFFFYFFSFFFSMFFFSVSSLTNTIWKLKRILIFFFFFFSFSSLFCFVLCIFFLYFLICNDRIVNLYFKNTFQLGYFLKIISFCLIFSRKQINSFRLICTFLILLIILYLFVLITKLFYFISFLSFYSFFFSCYSFYISSLVFIFFNFCSIFTSLLSIISSFFMSTSVTISYFHFFPLFPVFSSFSSFNILLSAAAYNHQEIFNKENNAINFNNKNKKDITINNYLKTFSKHDDSFFQNNKINEAERKVSEQETILNSMDKELFFFFPNSSSSASLPSSASHPSSASLLRYPERVVISYSLNGCGETYQNKEASIRILSKKHSRDKTLQELQRKIADYLLEKKLKSEKESEGKEETNLNKNKNIEGMIFNEIKQKKHVEKSKIEVNLSTYYLSSLQMEIIKYMPNGITREEFRNIAKSIPCIYKTYYDINKYSEESDMKYKQFLRNNVYVKEKNKENKSNTIYSERKRSEQVKDIEERKEGSKNYRATKELVEHPEEIYEKNKLSSDGKQRRRINNINKNYDSSHLKEDARQEGKENNTQGDTNNLWFRNREEMPNGNQELLYFHNHAKEETSRLQIFEGNINLKSYSMQQEEEIKHQEREKEKKHFNSQQQFVSHQFNETQRLISKQEDFENDKNKMYSYYNSNTSNNKNFKKSGELPHLTEKRKALEEYENLKERTQEYKTYNNYVEQKITTNGEFSSSSTVEKENKVILSSKDIIEDEEINHDACYNSFQNSSSFFCSSKIFFTEKKKNENHQEEKLEEITPNDEFFKKQWNLIDRHPWSIKIEETWNIWTGERNPMVVAVIDSGCDLNHPEIKEKLWKNPGEICGDGIDNDNNGFVDDCHGWDFVKDDNDPNPGNSGHGTGAAGIIGAATNNIIGIAGICWGCTIMCLKFMGDGQGAVADQIRAIDYAVKMGAWISNNSYGGYGFAAVEYDAIQRAQLAGHLFVTSAGNHNLDTDNPQNDHTPSSYSLLNILSVGAISHLGEKAPFSNYGKKTVHILAPGTGIRTIERQGNYMSVSGTSFAAPIVSGAAALIWSAFPSLSFFHIKTALIEGCKLSESLSSYSSCGGSINLYEAFYIAANMVSEQHKKNYKLEEPKNNFLHLSDILPAVTVQNLGNSSSALSTATNSSLSDFNFNATTDLLSPSSSTSSPFSSSYSSISTSSTSSFPDSLTLNNEMSLQLIMPLTATSMPLHSINKFMENSSSLLSLSPGVVKNEWNLVSPFSLSTALY